MFRLSGTIQEKELYAAMKFDSRMYRFNSVEFTAEQESRPRFIKTHLPFSLLPDQIKNGTKKPKVTNTLYLLQLHPRILLQF